MLRIAISLLFLSLNSFAQTLLEPTDFEKKLREASDVPEFPEPISVVLAGGTSLAGSFDKVFKQEIDKIKLPFQIKDIRLADDQMFAVAKGCLYSALSEYEDE